LAAGGADAAAPVTPVIGFLAGGLASASEAPVAGFRQGLRQTGYVEGQNLHIAFRWAEGRYERLSQLAAELASLNVSAITAIGALPHSQQLQQQERFQSVSSALSIR
jgi:putative ABC transport system substrate-binding protein